MSRKLIIDGNAVYELDENCMLTKRIDTENAEPEDGMEKKRVQKNVEEYKKNLREF